MLLSFLSNLLSHVFFLFGYISSNNLFPEPLSKTEEEFYLRKYFAGDKNARDNIIMNGFDIKDTIKRLEECYQK